MKLALIGTHGIGKTTLCFELAARFKRRNLDVEMVREVARSCPLPINQQTTVAAQEWILHVQMSLEIEAVANHEMVLCDRSVLDNYCYLVHSAGTDATWEKILDRWLPTYDLLIHVPIWSHPTFDGVRAVDPVFQEEIDTLLEGMIAARGLTPFRLDSERQSEWGRDIVKHLLPRIEPTPWLFSRDDSDRNT
ncbi:MAG: ATP-binding protein [bacterium]|nr:ATP-binding protein [bacterium]